MSYIFILLLNILLCERITCLCRSNIASSYSSIDDFSEDMCSQCYQFMIISSISRPYLTIDHNRDLIKYWQHIPSMRKLCPYNDKLYNHCYTISYKKLASNKFSNDFILNTFINNFYRNIFISCCRNAYDCCLGLMNITSPTDGKYCHAKWDGWECWPYTKASTSVYKTCPEPAYQAHNRIPATCLRSNAIKTCLPNGEWLSKNGREITDYSDCTYIGQPMNIIRNQLRIWLYFISLLTSLISCLIFIFYRQYKILRIKVHLNFFLSFIFTSITSIMFRYLVTDTHLDIKKDNIINMNVSWCIILYVLLKTSRLSNYCWMLCEGIYLHQLIVAAFHEQKSMLLFHLLGWGLPIATMIPYCIVHSFREYNKYCWTVPMGNIEWICNVIPLFALMANFILLVNIVRILFTKLRASPEHFRAAIRATGILIPVFGLHYLFYLGNSYLLETCNPFLIVLLYLGSIIESLEGAVVSAIFCFLNSEVHHVIKRSLRKYSKIDQIMSVGNKIGSNNQQSHIQLSTFN